MSMKENAQTIAENVPKVYEAGELAGIKNKSIWRAIQRVNATGDYANVKNNCSFMFHNFDTRYFYPQFDIKPTIAAFFARDMTGEAIDLVERLAECGVTMDFSNCTQLQTTFYNSKFYHFPELDFRKVITVSLPFGKNVVTIDKIILSPTVPMETMFLYSSDLENVTIEGTIGAIGNVSLTSCKKLTLASAKSILAA